jgi:hypothetical protein
MKWYVINQIQVTYTPLSDLGVVTIYGSHRVSLVILLDSMVIPSRMAKSLTSAQTYIYIRTH